MSATPASIGEFYRLPRGVLWDLDGTLLDSTEFHWLAWRETLASESRHLSFQQFSGTFGQRNDTILRNWLGADLSDEEVQRIGNAKEERYRQLVRAQGAQVLPGVRGWLDRLCGSGWRQAIASSAPRLNIDTILDALGISHYFSAIVSAEDVLRGKPDPQVFLVAAGRLSIPPAHCVVVEDSPAGIEGAHRAGMRAIGVRAPQAAPGADQFVASLDELPPDTFDRLLNGRLAESR